MKALALYNQYSRRAAALLAAVCAVSIFSYGAFLLLAVSHAAGLRAIEEQLAAINAEVSALQGSYIAKTRGLTIEHAYALGFVEPIAQSTVAASADGLSLAPLGEAAR